MQTRTINYPFPFINPHLIFISGENRDKNLEPSKEPIEQVNSGNGPFRIMMVDDDIDDRDMFTEAAAELNMNLEVQCIDTGRELMKTLSGRDSRLPAVIVLDLNMPDKSGRECIDFIRSHEHLRHVPVVIYSTSSSSKDIEDTYNKGANLYIKKPSSYTHLKEIIKAIARLNWAHHKPFGPQRDFLFKLDK